MSTMKITVLKAGHSLIWDDLMNERSLENGYVPTNLAHGQTKFVTPKVPKPLLFKVGNDNKHAKDLVKSKDGQESANSGHDDVMPVPEVHNDRPDEVPQPLTEDYADFLESTRSEASTSGTEGGNTRAQGIITAAPTSGKNAGLKSDKKTSYEKTPSAANWPPNINPKALELWPEFIRKYGKVCKDAGTTLDKQWACALAIWRNYTIKRRVAPFDAKASYLNQDTQDYMLKRTEASRRDLSKMAIQVVKKLTKQGLVKRATKERVVGVDYSVLKKRYNLTSGIPLKLTTEYKSADFRSAIKTLGFTYRSGLFVRATDKGHDLFVIQGEGDDSAVLLMTQYFNEQQVKFILGIQDEALKNRDAIVRKLAVFLKTVVKDQPLVIDF